MILDKSQRTEKYSEADFLVNMGIPTWIDAKHAIAHNKIMVIDEATVITGSFNFTKAAEERNAENMLVIRDKALAENYTANWQAHVEHSDAYEGHQENATPTETPARNGKRRSLAGRRKANNCVRGELARQPKGLCSYSVFWSSQDTAGILV